MTRQPPLDEPARDRERGTRAVVGVTGHRLAGLAGADHSMLTERIQRALAVTQRLAGAGRLTIVSPLAEGADRIVARAALDGRHELLCVLPFPRGVYAQDFPTAPSRAEYNALVSLASQVIELHGSNATPEARDAAYAAVGDWIIAHSDALIAIWDGGEARGSGGTGDVVRDALAAGVPVVWVHSRPPHAIKALTVTDGSVTEHEGSGLEAMLVERTTT
ncbi:MAG TPA: hypothetical protein VMM78_05570 [Thermomicrobiales bacterium]|nr:hypothetical protein [Thermomicrobiales bacterium]